MAYGSKKALRSVCDDVVMFELIVEEVDLERWRVWLKSFEGRFWQEKIVIRQWAVGTI